MKSILILNKKRAIDVKNFLEHELSYILDSRPQKHNKLNHSWYSFGQLVLYWLKYPQKPILLARIIYNFKPFAPLLYHYPA